MVEKIEIKNPDDLKEGFRQMAIILHNLRFFTKYWGEHGGYQARKNMKFWQEKADDLLNKMGLTAHNNIKSIKIIQ